MQLYFFVAAVMSRVFRVQTILTASNSEKIEECGNVKLKEPPQVVIQAMRKWGITTPLQKAHFLAQCAHESGNFIYTKEINNGKLLETDVLFHQ